MPKRRKPGQRLAVPNGHVPRYEGSQILDRVLLEEEAGADGIRERIHRTQLSRYRNDHARPEHPQLMLIAEQIGGKDPRRVLAHLKSWITAEERARLAGRA